MGKHTVKDKLVCKYSKILPASITLYAVRLKVRARGQISNIFEHGIVMDGNYVWSVLISIKRYSMLVMSVVWKSDSGRTTASFQSSVYCLEKRSLLQQTLLRCDKRWLKTKVGKWSYHNIQFNEQSSYNQSTRKCRVRVVWKYTIHKRRTRFYSTNVTQNCLIRAPKQNFQFALLCCMITTSIIHSNLSKNSFKNIEILQPKFNTTC